MKFTLSKTNSWHWLIGALCVGTIGAIWEWTFVLQEVSGTIAPQLLKQDSHLQTLQELDTFEPDRLDRQTKQLEVKLIALQQRLTHGGIAPTPQGPDSVVAVKNRIDQALARHQLHIAKGSLSISLATKKQDPKPSSKLFGPPQSETQQRSQTSEEEFILSYDLAKLLESYNAIQDKAIREQTIISEKRRSVRILAQQAKLKAKGVKLKATPPPKSTVTPQPVKPKIKAQLPFSTEEIAYVVTGDFKQMFLFLVQQSFKKHSYNFKHIQVIRLENGEMEMSFILQVNYL